MVLVARRPRSVLFLPCLSVLLPVLLLIPDSTLALQVPAGNPVGVVTAIQGRAIVARPALPQPAALRFKDDVFLRDQIATRERSTVRLLLGGRATITVRELSQFTIEESVLPDGTQRSIISLLAGKIGAAIARGLMRPGESVEIRTPNAVAAVRGTVFIAEYIPPQGSAAAPEPLLLASASPGHLVAQAPGAAGGISVFLVLSGQLTMTIPGVPPLTLGPLQSVSIVTGPTGVQVGPLQTVSAAEVAQAAQGLDTGKPHTGESEASRTAQGQVAAAVANVILQATTGQPAVTPILTVPTSPTSAAAPVVPQPAVGGAVGENVLPSGDLLTLNNVTLGLAANTSLATFSAGTPNTLSPLNIQGLDPMTVVGVAGTPLAATGDPISHSGAIATLTGKATLTGAPDGTPVVKIEKTTLNNSGGPIFDLGGGSALRTFGPAVSVGSFLNLGSDPVIRLRGNSTFENTAGPIIKVNDGSLTAGALGDANGNSSWKLNGTVLDLQDATAQLGAMGTETDKGSVSFTLNLAPGEPAVRMVNSNLTLTRDGEDVVGFESQSETIQTGVAIMASATTPGKTIETHGSILDLSGGSGAPPGSMGSGTPGKLVLADPNPQINLKNMTANVLGNDGLLEASGTVEIKAVNVIFLDEAVVKATADVVRLINADLETGTMVGSIDSVETSATTYSATGAIHILKSNVTSNGVFNLDNSTLTIRNAPALTLKDGAKMTVDGDFATLTNSGSKISKITVQNGVMIYVDGIGSELLVKGAFINFMGKGGNEVVITNSVAPTHTLSGIPVSQTGDASITIGPNPIKNPGKGVLNVTCPGECSGSAIKASNGGKVTIAAP